MAKRSVVALLKAERKQLQDRLEKITQALVLLGGENPLPRAQAKGKKKRKVSAATRTKMRAAWKRRKAAAGKK